MLHSFTRNHTDHSTESGFQFEFFCDCCGDGFKSTFVSSSTYGKKTRNERIGRALGYLKDHPKTLAILSGGNGEAQAMFDALTAAGISENRLILEGKSTSTWQNLKYSLPMTEDKTVGIVSSDYHLFRAKLYIKEGKIALIGAKTKDFPRWAHNFCREIAGVWHYFILGGTYE